MKLGIEKIVYLRREQKVTVITHGSSLLVQTPSVEDGPAPLRQINTQSNIKQTGSI
jgi:hypothetical protein